MQVTYDKLFEYLREERNNPQLQKLPPDFFQGLIDYLKAKESSIESLHQSGSLTEDSAREQLKNARKIIENIYERREKKIALMALNKSRTKSQLIDTSALLAEERVFFKQLTFVFDHFRDEVVKKVLFKETPSINETKDFALPADEADEPAVVPEPEVVAVSSRVKFLQYVDKFVGPDLEILGPFEVGDVVELSPDLVAFVVSKGYAQRF